MTSQYYYRQVHRSTWVCLTCSCNVDKMYRKDHALWHANNVQQCRFDPGEVLVRGFTLFRVSISYNNGVNTVEKVQLL